jgi:hypothetical protein
MDDKRPDRVQDGDKSGPARLMKREAGPTLSLAMYSSLHHLAELWRLFLRLVGQSPKHPKPNQ